MEGRKELGDFFLNLARKCFHVIWARRVAIHLNFLLNKNQKKNPNYIFFKSTIYLFSMFYLSLTNNFRNSIVPYLSFPVKSTIQSTKCFPPNLWTHQFPSLQRNAYRGTFPFHKILFPTPFLSLRHLPTSQETQPTRRMLYKKKGSLKVLFSFYIINYKESLQLILTQIC